MNMSRCRPTYRVLLISQESSENEDTLKEENMLFKVKVVASIHSLIRMITLILYQRY
jgi:hypothetical protein